MAIETLAAIQMVDVELPSTDGRTLTLSRYTEPEPGQKLLVQHLKLTDLLTLGIRKSIHPRRASCGTRASIEAITGAALSRILADAGYKGHNAPEEHKFKVYPQGQKRGVTEAIKRQLKRRAAIEPVIGHCAEEHRMGRNFLALRDGDAINPILAAAGYNFRRLLAWLEPVLRLLHELPPQSA